MENKGFKVLNNEKKILFLGFFKIFLLENKGFKVLNNGGKKVFLGFLKIFSLKNKGFGVVKNEEDFLVFENLGKLFWIMGLEIIWNIHCKSI